MKISMKTLSKHNKIMLHSVFQLRLFDIHGVTNRIWHEVSGVAEHGAP
jgi:hypothetical protein